jgi:hypothetical protein
MLGPREAGQGQFFYSFDLDKVVPSNHPRAVRRLFRAPRKALGFGK